jgi:hypothetical protein
MSSLKKYSVRLIEGEPEALAAAFGLGYNLVIRLLVSKALRMKQEEIANARQKMLEQLSPSELSEILGKSPEGD